jgi:hypothetical protein
MSDAAVLIFSRWKNFVTLFPVCNYSWRNVTHCGAILARLVYLGRIRVSLVANNKNPNPIGAARLQWKENATKGKEKEGTRRDKKQLATGRSVGVAIVLVWELYGRRGAPAAHINSTIEDRGCWLTPNNQQQYKNPPSVFYSLFHPPLPPICWKREKQNQKKKEYKRRI